MSKVPEKEQQSKTVVYIPANTIVNIGDDKAPPPVTAYEDRRWSLCRKAVKKFVGGVFGVQDEGN